MFRNVTCQSHTPSRHSSNRTDAPYRSGPSRMWVKTKNPASDAVRREREEKWREPWRS